jgi:AhpD family alkylhydroperoxidase
VYSEEEELDKTPDSQDFLNEREELNRVLLGNADKVIKRFLSLDAITYRAGALPAETKELLGLVASLVLRCNDCINWHLTRCHEEEVTTDRIIETMGIGMVVGGSITIPHVRKAMKFWEGIHEGGDDA